MMGNRGVLDLQQWDDHDRVAIHAEHEIACVQRRDRLLTIRGKAPSQLHAKLQVSSTQSSKSAPRKAPSQLHAKLQVSSTQSSKSAPRKASSQLHAKLQVSSTQSFKSAPRKASSQLANTAGMSDLEGRYQGDPIRTAKALSMAQGVHSAPGVRCHAVTLRAPLAIASGIYGKVR